MLVVPIINASTTQAPMPAPPLPKPAAIPQPAQAVPRPASDFDNVPAAKVAPVPKTPAIDPTPTQYVEKPTLKTAKCVFCHTQMAIAFTKAAPHGGVQCVSRKGCEERKAIYEASLGSDGLKAAMNASKSVNETPKESALRKLGQGEAPNGMRITKPTDKELKNAGLIRVTDGSESDNEPTLTEEAAKLAPENKLLNPMTATERDRRVIYEMEERQGIGFIIKEALTAEGFASIPSHLIGIIIESAKDTGEISHEGFTNILAVLAKAAKGTGHPSLGFFMAQAYFNETSKRVSGF